MKSLIIVFCKNPILGRTKSRLANKIGKHKALEVYKYLLTHTADCVKESGFSSAVFYSEFIPETDLWDNVAQHKVLQEVSDLGSRMHCAFQWAFNKGYDFVLIIGSDLWSLKPKDIDLSFKLLLTHDVVIGPAKDGGYYLLGLKQLKENIFKSMPWSTDQVLSKTLNALEGNDVFLLEEKNDIDIIEDLEDHPDLLEKIRPHE